MDDYKFEVGKTYKAGENYTAKIIHSFRNTFIAEAICNVSKKIEYIFVYNEQGKCIGHWYKDKIYTGAFETSGLDLVPPPPVVMFRPVYDDGSVNAKYVSKLDDLTKKYFVGVFISEGAKSPVFMSMNELKNSEYKDYLK